MQENVSYSNEEKEVVLNNWNKNILAEDQYISFFINSGGPLSENDIQISFKLYGSDGTSILENVLFIAYKNVLVTEHGFFQESTETLFYSNIWLIKANKPIIIENYGNIFPIYLEVTFPNDESSTYLIKS